MFLNDARPTTQIENLDENDAGAVLEKGCHDARRNTKKRRGANVDAAADGKGASPKRVLRRKRMHNFCPHLLAHDFLSYRRVDRFFHRATLRLEEGSSSHNEGSAIDARPFLVFSLTGDIFLQEQ